MGRETRTIRWRQCVALISTLLGLAVCPVLADALQLQIMPAAPRYQEPVYARLVRPPLDFGVLYGATTSMAANRITIVYYEYPELSNSSRDVLLGQLPAGEYKVDLVDARFGTVEATAQFTVADSPIPTRGADAVPSSARFTGHWWNAFEPGWGLSIEQGPTNLLFMTWFVHDVTGNPTWYTIEPGTWNSAETFMTFEGPIYRTTGGYFAAPVAAPAQGIQVGTGTVSFRDAQTGTLNFVIDGVRTIKSITRLPIE